MRNWWRSWGWTFLGTVGGMVTGSLIGLGVADGVEWMPLPVGVVLGVIGLGIGGAIAGRSATKR